jgi:hypothetical protein
MPAYGDAIVDTRRWLIPIAAIGHRPVRGGFASRFNSATPANRLSTDAGVFLACDLRPVEKDLLLSKVDAESTLLERASRWRSDVGQPPAKYAPH